MKKIFSVLIMLCITMSSIPFFAFAQEGKTENNVIDVVFTHDLHSHLESYIDKNENGVEEELGGFARIAGFIKSKKSENKDTLVLDAGDFSMGTLYESLYEIEAPELRLLGAMGVDVTTLGNHEFDYGADLLAQMFEAAKNSKEPLPKMVLANIDHEKSKENNEDYDDIKRVFDDYGLQPYTVIEKNGVKIAVFGIFGNASIQYLTNNEVLFKDPIESAKEVVDKIKTSENADMIVCLSHSGISKDESKSEDENLAKAVPDIDLIISGHTHSLLQEPIVHGSTTIVSCGEYGKYVGSLSLEQQDDNRWSAKNYQIVKMDSSITEDSQIAEKIQDFEQIVNTVYLNRYGYKKDDVLCYNSIENISVNEMYKCKDEVPYMSLLADSYIHYVRENGVTDNDIISVVPAGVIRYFFPKDKNITVSDVFDVFPLEKSMDNFVGSPLVKVYLTGSEVKLLAEIFISFPEIDGSINSGYSGMKITYNPNRFILDRVTNVQINNDKNEKSEIDNDKLYAIVTDKYTFNLLGLVNDYSMGLMTLVPKDENGNTVTNVEDVILKDENGYDLKSWLALASYLESFEDGQVPDKYSAPTGRKIADNDNSFLAVIKNPSKIASIAYGIILAIIAVIVLVIFMIIVLVKRRKKHKNKLNRR